MIKIHFLNVGHGDCILVEFLDSGRLTVIDVNRSSEFEDESKAEIEVELLSMVEPIIRFKYQNDMISFADLAKAAGDTLQVEDPLEYFKAHGVKSIFRFISTHPHMDHLTGLTILKTEFGIRNFWILDNNFKQVSSKMSEEQKEDWKLYSSLRNSPSNSESNPTIIKPYDGDTRHFIREDNITILAPNSQLVDLAHQKNNNNIMSYVLLIEYGSHKIILGGDAENDTWEYILDNYEEKIKNVTILKASHHGRDSGYFQKAVAVMNPAYTIVSVGKKPETDASNKYRRYCDNVFSTRWHGNIVFSLNSDGTGNVSKQHNR